MASFDFPSSPTVGQTYAPVGGPVFTWDGTAWKGTSQGAPVTVYVSDTAPLSPAIGQLWWNSATGTMAIWYADSDSAQWVQVSGQVKSPPGWEFIKSETLGAIGAFVDIRDLGSYRNLRITGTSQCVTSGGRGWVQVSSNNGVSFDGGAADYNTEQIVAKAGVITSVGVGQAAMYIQDTTNGMYNVANFKSSFTALLFDFNQPLYTWCMADAYYITADGNLCRAMIGSERRTMIAQNAIRLGMTGASGFANLHYVLEGIRG